MLQQHIMDSLLMQVAGLDTAEDHWSLIETESLIKSLMQQTYKKEESGNIVDQC